MASAAETTDIVQDHTAISRNAERSAATEIGGEQFSGPLSAAFSGAFDDPESKSATKLLRKPALSHSANSAVRSQTIMRAQRTHGNHFLQRALAHGSGNTHSSVQRECACGGTCKACQETQVSYSELTENELKELQREAISELRVRAGYDPYFVGPMPGLSTDELLRTRGDEIKAIMRDLHGEEMGQIAKDFERLMPGADETAVTILIDGKPTRVRASRASTRAIGFSPIDVSIQDTIKYLTDLGIKIEASGVGLTAQEVENLARRLRAEALTNGARVGPPP